MMVAILFHRVALAQLESTTMFVRTQWSTSLVRMLFKASHFVAKLLLRKVPHLGLRNCNPLTFHCDKKKFDENDALNS
jgi:hypothetical protein